MSLLQKTTMSAADIKTLYESNAETNAFDDSEQTHLAGIDAGATDDQTGGEIKTAYEGEANAFTDTKNTKLDGIEAGATDGAPAISAVSAGTPGSAWSLIKEIQVKVAGTGTLKVEHHATASNGFSYLQFKLNGGNIGSQDTAPGTTWVWHELEQASLVADDLIQVYMSHANSYAACRNFSVHIACGVVTKDSF